MKKFSRRCIPTILGLLVLVSAVNPGYHSSGEIAAGITRDPPFLKVNSHWVDSIMNGMSLDEKIAQMIMVQAYSDKDQSYQNDLLKLVEKYRIGGLIFFTGGPVRQALLTNRLQEASEIPLLIAMDAEWGLDMRLDSVIKYPRQMELGAVRNDQLIYQLGRDFGSQLRNLGVHMNFSPVADINNNPDNPVINTRSFGEDRDDVSNKVVALFSGMQKEKLLVTAKHFPGHGDTNIDSHYDLPVLDFSRERLDSLELYPFKEAVRRGVSGIMVAHLNVRALDPRENIPASLSYKVVSDLLRGEMKFKGLIVSDAMSMKGVSNHFKPGEGEVEAAKAGNDIILMPTDVSRTISEISRAVRKGEIPMEQIDASCRRILQAKKWLGLDTIRSVNTVGLTERLNSRSYLPVRQELAERTITLLKNENDVVPLKNLESIQLATLNFGVAGPTAFTRQLDLYHSCDHFFYHTPLDFPADSTLNKDLSDYNTLIVSLYYTRSFGRNFDIPAEVKELLNRIDFNGNMIINLFGYPYALGVLGELDNADAIMISFTKEELNQQFSAQGIFGGISLSGRLPVSVGVKYPVGSGLIVKGGNRLSYSCPEAVSMSYDSLLRIEEVISEAIRNKAMPGCQVLVARKGRVVWNKSYGYHTYLNRQPVQNDHLYDLASVTKIAATIPAIMQLQDMQLFSLDKTLGDYFPEIDTSEKADLQIRDILTHQAGLQPWIPFFTNTIEPMDSSFRLYNNNYNDIYPLKIGPGLFANRNIKYKEGIFMREYSPEYPVEVAKNLYQHKNYRDSIYHTILRSPLGNKEYKYSDLGYYYLYRIVEDVAGEHFYPFLWNNFFAPMGAETLGFLPLNRFDKNRIVPTENDLIFRKQLIRGYVHDPGAAMLGGICGHAGLFSNANDLAKIMQMYLNHGTYGDRRYIDSVTVAEYTRCQFCDFENRRALGFDRPITDEDDAGPASNSASERSYGHSGFTGTIVWMDPEYDLLYIFLSNRVHPDQSNAKLISMNVRTRIQEMIYQSILPE
jgi:beta-N-acetylhexosaminidase